MTGPFELIVIAIADAVHGALDAAPQLQRRARSRVRRSPPSCAEQLAPRQPDDPRIGRERLRHDLIHVVVLVGREPADEVHAFGGVGELLILAVERGVLRPRNRIVGIAFGARILVDQRGFRVLLPGDVLEFGDPGVGVVVRDSSRPRPADDARSRAFRT